jgi:5,10-methylenetetrahydromethanopterin reductase
MDFGTLIFTKPERAISDVRYAEERGFTHAWIPDSHMIWGDTYACMALAAVNTKTIKLGTGVAIATNRIAPVTVHSIATINQLAPGRVILGFGTGHTGRRVMGLPPVKHAEFREQVRVIHDLLHDGEATYNTEGLSRKIRYLHRDRRFINLDDRIPFYVAANGPKTLALAGEFGDGAITTGITDPDRVAAVRKNIAAGAAKVGRDSSEMPIVSLTHVCVLRPGEKLDSPRVKQMTGHWVMASFHAIAAGYASASYLPPKVQQVYSAYEKYVSEMKTPAAERYLELHIGHCTYVAPDEQKYVTPDTIAATTMIGPREEIVERLRALERAGLSQVFINPPMDAFNDCIDEISRDVIERI